MAKKENPIALSIKERELPGHIDIRLVTIKIDEADGRRFPSSTEFVGPYFTDHGELGVTMSRYQNRYFPNVDIMYNDASYVGASKLRQMSKTIGDLTKKLQAVLNKTGGVHGPKDVLVALAMATGAAWVFMPRSMSPDYKTAQNPYYAVTLATACAWLTDYCERAELVAEAMDKTG